MNWPAPFLIVLILALGIYGLHRLALYAERRGWLYYKHRKAPRGAASMALLELDQIWKPEIEHVVDEMETGYVRVAEDEKGEDD